MKYTLGIDVGGTKIAAALVDMNGSLSQVHVVKTSQTDLVKQLTLIIESYQGFYKAIGLAMPGFVKPDGTVVKLPNIKNFKKTNLKTLLKQKFHVPIHVMNDAKAFTLAEAVLGSGKKHKTVVGAVLGTGIGSGLVRNKNFPKGADYMEGEIGHIKIGSNVTLEQIMQREGKSQTKQQRQLLIETILLIVTKKFNPDIVVFGGGRMNHPGMQQVLNQALKATGVKPLAKVFKLKHAGIVGAVLPLLKK